MTKNPLKIRQADPNYEAEKLKYPNPLPSRAYMLQLLAEHRAPMTADALGELLAIEPDEEAFFNRRLNAMVREGELKVNRQGAFLVADKAELIAGRVQGHAEGYGFVIPDAGGDDLFLSAREMYQVMHGDQVLAREIGVDRRGRPEGKIIEITKRAHTRLVGRVMEENGVRFVQAEDSRISQEILLVPDNNLPAAVGQVVTVAIITPPGKHNQPTGRIVEVLGNYTDPGMEIEIALRKHALPHEFSTAAMAQANKTPQQVEASDWKTPEGLQRQDLRQLPLVTIDGETSRDFDDAVYAERLQPASAAQKPHSLRAKLATSIKHLLGKPPQVAGWRLVVAIADVSHYVRPGDALDETALERGNSVYFPRRVIPMLPEAISNGICSLNPNVERNCMVCDMQISDDGELLKHKFYPAVMQSKARLTYNQVWDIIQHPNGDSARQQQPVVPHLQNLYALFKILLAARTRRGAIDFDTTETQMIFDDAGKIDRIEVVRRNDAHRVIEECMLAANVCAAQYLAKHKHDVLYRVHEGPSKRKLEGLRRFLAEHALALGGGDKPTTLDYAKLVAQIKSRPDVELLQTMLLRSMQQAVYSPEKLGHFGLAYDAYAHFTSPIRRYPDLLVHRAIKAVLTKTQYKPGKWEEIGAHCSQTERRADDATRDVDNWLKCYFMNDHLGEVFEGRISSITHFGIFVLLDNLHIEGLVHISILGADYFQFDEARHVLRGERTGKVYALTDRVTIKVARADLNTSKIDFVMVDDGTDNNPSRKKKKSHYAFKQKSGAVIHPEKPHAKKDKGQ